ncbi:Putative methyltransferase C9orf114 [Sarcoptes scabiei]|uniref:Putative methyltransferase C9orf114 n=1 Tax=Sarcoptes scabiei TaxID=52283 RepID=A0A131ZVG4_SARSC|nr:Putative methyltransferase C9orf114 [Sarcoptes scabiei]KPM02796.1 RNA methyltransferase-like protein 2 [Sarcoptes scabiei]
MEIDSSGGRDWTVSIAIPSSIVDNAQSQELRSYLIGQIARSLIIFNIDEIVVYDETCSGSETTKEQSLSRCQQTLQMTVRILEYLECPQYLRKQLFPLQPCLRYAGLLNPLESPHHLSITDQCPYREGVVLDKLNQNGFSCVDIGLKQDCEIDRCLQPGIRVTIKIDPDCSHKRKTSRLKGVVVSPSEPREKCGIYWGYSIRIAHSLSDVLNQCPFDDNGSYDLRIGTSDKGDNIDRSLKKIPNQFKHLLIVFGGLRGIEYAHQSDRSLRATIETSNLFDYYLNTCPNQGSDTIRTEEAILITLAALRKRLFRARKC